MKHIKSYKLFEAFISVDKWNETTQPDQETADIINNCLLDLEDFKVRMSFGDPIDFFKYTYPGDEYKNLIGHKMLCINITRNIDADEIIDDAFYKFNGKEIAHDMKEVIAQLSDKYEFVKFCKDDMKDFTVSKNFEDLNDNNIIGVRFDFKSRK